MKTLLELTLANGLALDIPAPSITMFEAMHRGKNASFPDARAFVRYTIADKDKQAVLADSFDDLVRLLDINVRPGAWLLLTREDGDRVALLEGNVVAREAIEQTDTSTGACKLTVSYGAAHAIGELIVRETRDEVKAQMDRPAPEPVPILEPETPIRPRKPRRS